MNDWEETTDAPAEGSGAPASTAVSDDTWLQWAPGDGQPKTGDDNEQADGRLTSPLQLEGISKSFPGVKALQDVHFAAAAGEVHALLGENGAGKSTLIKIISGVHRPDEGTVRIDGREVDFQSPRDAQDAGIATIYQELSLYPELSVAENMFMGHAPMRRFGRIEVVDWKLMNERAREVLAAMDIHDLDVRRKVGTLSVGNRQRIEIAKALSVNAKVLIMDEPTAALTESDVEHLFRLVRLLKERGVAIIYISHRLVEVFQVADRVTVLRDGRYVNSKRVADTTEDELIRMMVGHAITDLFPKLPTEIKGNVLEVRNLNRRATHQRRQLHRPRRRDGRDGRPRRFRAAARPPRSSSASTLPTPVRSSSTASR